MCYDISTTKLIGVCSVHKYGVEHFEFSQCNPIFKTSET